MMAETDQTRGEIFIEGGWYTSRELIDALAGYWPQIAEGLPNDIAAAIDAFGTAAEQFGGQTWIGPGDGDAVTNARAALAVAILARLANRNPADTGALDQPPAISGRALTGKPRS